MVWVINAMSGHDTNSKLGGGLKGLADLDVGNIEEVVSITVGAEGFTLDGYPLFGSLEVRELPFFHKLCSFLGSSGFNNGFVFIAY